MKRIGVVLVFAALVLAIVLSTCSRGVSKDPVERGRIVYEHNCAACHNLDPRKPGISGPEVAGSSRDLVEARVLRAQYPPGYVPKRIGSSMVALPHLVASIDDLAAYLKAMK